jgi:hypothetical protein
MKSVFIFILLTSLAQAQGVLIKGSLDPDEVILPKGFKLWAAQKAQELRDRPLRENLLENSTLYLQGRVTEADFLDLLKNWSALGFNLQERRILIDSIEKSEMLEPKRSRWLCRLDLQRHCKRIKIFPDHLAPILGKYEFLILDGLMYPRSTWAQIEIPDEDFDCTFFSSRFETYRFHGRWMELRTKSPETRDWVTGKCDHFTVLREVQNIETYALLENQCLKIATQEEIRQPDFFERHRDKIWTAVGIFVGVGVIASSRGQKIIIEKPR